MRSIRWLAVVALAILVACGGGGASPQPERDPFIVGEWDVGQIGPEPTSVEDFDVWDEHLSFRADGTYSTTLVAVWNNGASSYSVATTGTWSSQKHEDVPGNLLTTRWTVHGVMVTKQVDYLSNSPVTAGSGAWACQVETNVDLQRNFSSLFVDGVLVDAELFGNLGQPWRRDAYCQAP